MTRFISYALFCGIADKERSWQNLVDTGEDLIAQHACTNEATNLQDAVESFRLAARLGLGEARDAQATFLRGARALIPNESSDNDGERGVQVPPQKMNQSTSHECERRCISMHLGA